MKQSEMKNAPWLVGWVIAAAAGLVAGAVTYVVGDFTLTKATFVGVIVMLAVGLFMGMPSSAAPLGSKAVKPAAKAEAAAAPKPATVAAAAPAMAEAAPAAASFMSAPVADAAPAKPVRAAKPKTAPAAKAAAKPAVKAAAKPAPAKAPRVKKPDGPERLSAPRRGKADDLKEIEGIGPALEKLCNELGFYHFDQIAKWSAADVDWVDANMKTFKGRIVRDKWIAQSKIIITEGLEAFRVRAKTNDY